MPPTADAIVKAANWMMTVEPGEGQKFSSQLLTDLQELLTYTSYFYSPVKVKNEETGKWENPSKSSLERMWSFDNDGRFVCEYGAYPVVKDLLEKAGFRVRLFRGKEDVEREARAYREDWEAVYRRFDFRPRQEDCLAMIAAHEGGIIDAVTAFGKAYVIAMVCALYPDARILVTVKSRQIAKGLIRVISRYVSSVGFYTSGAKTRRYNRVMVCTAGSLDNMATDFDILLADEVHELTTNFLSEKLARFRNCRRFGFTASKETRMDGHYHRLLPMFGPTIFQIGFQEAVDVGLVTPVHVMWLHPEDHAWGPSPVPKWVKSDIDIKRFSIWRNLTRNELFANAARELRDHGMQVLLSCSNLEQALSILALLPDFELVCSTADVSAKRLKRLKSLDLPVHLLQGITEDELDEKNRRFQSRELMGVVATPVWNVGVSFDSLEVAARMDGTGSRTTGVQLPGRVCRLHDERGKDMGILLECSDGFEPSAAERALKRSSQYDSFGWTQTSYMDGQDWEEHKKIIRARLRRARELVAPRIRKRG